MRPGKAEEGGDRHSVYGHALCAMREMRGWYLVINVVSVTNKSHGITTEVLRLSLC